MPSEERESTDPEGHPNTDQTDPGVGQSGKASQREFLVLTIFAVAVLISLGIVFLKPYPSAFQQLFGYAIICIIPGIGLTFAQSATGHISLPKYGLTLTGSAAVGVAVLLIAKQFLVSEPPRLITICPTESKSQAAMVHDNSPNLRVDQLLGTSRFLAEFAPTSSMQTGAGFVTFDVTAEGGNTRVTYDVSPQGEVKRRGTSDDATC